MITLQKLKMLVEQNLVKQFKGFLNSCNAVLQAVQSVQISLALLVTIGVGIAGFVSPAMAFTSSEPGWQPRDQYMELQSAESQSAESQSIKSTRAAQSSASLNSRQAAIQDRTSASNRANQVRANQTRANQTGELPPAQTARPSARAETLSSGSMPPDVQRILDRGKLTVAILDRENPPFFTTDSSGQLVGLDVELAQAIADQLDVKLEFNRSAKTFDDVIKTVSGFEADLAISKLSRTLKRAQSIRFSQPYLNMRQGLLVNRLQIAQQIDGRSMTEVVRQLQGKVGVIRGSSYVGFTQKRFPQATVVEFPTWSDAVKAVVQGDVLAAYRDELEIKKTILNQPNTALTLQTIALSDTQDSIAIALPWSSQHLLAFVNQYLEISNVNYTADRVLEDYSTLLLPVP